MKLRGSARGAVKTLEHEDLGELSEVRPEVGVQQQDEHGVAPDVGREVALPSGPGVEYALVEPLRLAPHRHHYSAAAVRRIRRPPAQSTGGCQILQPSKAPRRSLLLQGIVSVNHRLYQLVAHKQLQPKHSPKFSHQDGSKMLDDKWCGN